MSLHPLSTDATFRPLAAKLLIDNTLTSPQSTLYCGGGYQDITYIVVLAAKPS